EDGTAKILFEVSDSGIGISPDQQSAIFEAFNQADPSITRQFGGTGLGLAICQQLVELMEGSISVRSERGIGSTFYFHIPSKLASATDVVETLLPPPTTASKFPLSILVAE